MRTKQLVTVIALAAVAVVMTAGVVQAQAKVRACEDCPPPEGLLLPPVGTAPGQTQVLTDPNRAVSILQLDDGTCESGLGAGTTVTSFQEFQVPTQCVTGGLEVVAVTGRMNSGAAQSFSFAQAGAAPGVGGFALIPAAFAPSGPCPATAVSSVGLPGGSAVVTGTTDFWGGLRNTGFAGRDSQTPGNVWLNCATCGMTQYTPATLTGFGLGGTWMIRVSVEDQNCVPVELMGFTVGSAE